MKKLLPYGLILIGSFLEVYYYALRFSSEGTFLSISIVQGVGLTALLMGVFLLRARWYVWLLIVTLGLYSVTNTAVGQRQALTNKIAAEEHVVNSRKISILEESIEREKRRHDEVAELLDVSVTSFDDAWEWKNTTAKYEEELATLSDSIETKEEEIASLLDGDINDSDIGRLYVFYSELTGMRPDRIQVLLQFVFSFFIAIMAPVGITLIPAKEPAPVFPVAIPEPKKKDYSEHVDRWVTYNWVGIRSGRSDKILSQESFFHAIDSRNVLFPRPAYDQIYSVAKNHKVVDKDKILCKDEKEAIKVIKENMEP